MKLSRRRAALLIAAAGLAGEGTSKARSETHPQARRRRWEAVRDMSKTYDVAAREAEITGRPPRIPPLKPHEIPEEAREAMNKLRAGLGLGPLEGDVPEFTATMMKTPVLMEAHLGLANFLFRGELAVRDRELAVLRLGWILGAPFEWGEHVKIGKRLAHVTDEEVLRIQKGSSAPGWNEHERAIIRAVEELVSDAMITDETWAVLAKTLNEKQLLEFPILIGQYQGVAYLQNSVRIRLLDGNAGLATL
jgi:alkylhydroperoxidase family enzyme